MERLTEKRDGQNVIPLRQNGKIKWAICSAGLGDAPTKYLYGDHADRLAAYEDTGLEPEEIELLAKQRDLYVDACGELPLKRIRELAQADREGRCVVLDDLTMADLQQMLTVLDSTRYGDGVETYTTGYRNGHRNGRIEILRHVLGINEGDSAETELRREQDGQDD